ncbi:MAG: cyclic nucleotide-binding domain-containing protein, partial [Actinomycetota bacterium]
MMPTISQSRTDTLRGLPMFKTSSDDEIALIDSIVEEIEVESHEVVLRENEEGSESFIIVNGNAVVTLAGVELTTLGPGDFFGEMAALEGGPRTATVTAITAMDLLVVDQADFSALLTQPGVAAYMVRAMVGRLRTAQDVRPRDLVALRDFAPVVKDDDPSASMHVWKEPVRGAYPGAEVFGLTGIEQLEGFFKGTTPRSPILRLTGIAMEEL